MPPPPNPQGDAQGTSRHAFPLPIPTSPSPSMSAVPSPLGIAQGSDICVTLGLGSPAVRQRVGRRDADRGG